MIDKKYLNEDGTINVDKIDSLPLFEHIQTLEMFNIQESDEYRKLSRERILSESEEAYHRSAQLTEEQFNSLEWVDADDILNEMRRIIEKAKNVI